MSLEERCYESGYRAYEAGVWVKTCPFKAGSLARRAWVDGWKDARHEYEDDPPED